MFFFYKYYGNHRELPDLTHSSPTRRSSDLHGPLALREHGNLSRRGIETDRDDADPGRFRGLDGEVPVSTDLGRCRTAVARAFGPKPPSRSAPKALAMNPPDARPHADVPAVAPAGATRRRSGERPVGTAVARPLRFGGSPALSKQ